MRTPSSALYHEWLSQELSRIEREVGPARFASGQFHGAAKQFTAMSQSGSFSEFLTLPAYELLD